MNTAESALHANIQCYIRDLLNDIDSPLVRNNIEKAIKSRTHFEAGEALKAAIDVLPNEWEQPLIDSLIDFMTDWSIPRKWRGFLLESKDYMGYGGQTSKWRFWLLLPRAWLRYKMGALKQYWF